MISTPISTSTHRVSALDRVGRLIGNTPLQDLSFLSPNPAVRVLAKLEWLQLGQSVKARPAFQIIRTALENRELRPDRTLLDASSGNTAIAYASIAAALGLKVCICLPENASRERKTILRSLGAELVITSPFEGTDGAQAKARELVEAHPEQYFYADQYNNPANWQSHVATTAPEILHQTDGEITHFITGLGTTGSFTGTSRGLKAANPEIRTIALHPATAMHGLEGWKHLETVKVPGIYDPSTADEHRTIGTEAAYAMVKRLAREAGLLVSPSAAANVAGALAYAAEIESGTLVTLMADDASKYSEVISHIF